MKALPLLLAVGLLAGCDKVSQALDPVPATPVPTPEPAPVVKTTPAPKSGDWLLNGYKNPLDGQRVVTPKPGAQPTPVPKQGEWMLKGYKNPLDSHKR